MYILTVSIERCVDVCAYRLKRYFRYGEIMNIELIRDKSTGKSKGFAFLQYEDQRSTVLAVDNLNGSKVSILDGRRIYDKYLYRK